jgi:hypothetical protein
MDSQTRKFQVMDDRLEAIENETHALQSKFTRSQKNVDEKIESEV